MKRSPVFFILISISFFAQRNIVSSGGTFTNSNGSISISIGQLYYSEHSNQQVSITEGLQQVFVDQTLSVNSYSTNEILVYPNPTNGYLFINKLLTNTLNVSYQIYETHGKLVSEGVLKEKKEIDLSKLSKGFYMLRLLINGKIYKNSKILKL